MKRKQIFSVATVGFLSLLLVAGAAVAAVFSEDNTFTGTVNQFEKGIKIGKQGTGGVTFFNGTIVNATTTDGADNPVTFGDNVRIDGRLQRGHNKEGDAWNVIVDDGLEVNKTLMVTGESTMKGKVKFEGGVEGIPTSDIDAYTKAESDGKYVTKDNPTWNKVTRTLSISPAEFNSAIPLAIGAYIRDGKSLYTGGVGGPSAWSAPVYLPDGAVVKKISIDYTAPTADRQILMNLRNMRTSTGELDMASIATTGYGAVVNNAFDDSIVDATVDNDTAIYYLNLVLNKDGTYLFGTRIEYEVTQPY